MKQVYSADNNPFSFPFLRKSVKLFLVLSSNLLGDFREVTGYKLSASQTNRGEVEKTSIRVEETISSLFSNRRETTI